MHHCGIMYIVFSVQIQVPDERDGSGDAVPGSAAVKLVSLWSVDFFSLKQERSEERTPTHYICRC